MKENNADILIYLNQVKNFLNRNDDAKSYFLKDIDSEKFYDRIYIESNKNLKNNGDPSLSREQLESIRNDLLLDNERKYFFNGFSIS